MVEVVLALSPYCGCLEGKVASYSICSLEGGIVDHANEDCLSSVDYSICQALCPGSHSSGIK